MRRLRGEFAAGNSFMAEGDARARYRASGRFAFRRLGIVGACPLRATITATAESLRSAIPLTIGARERGYPCRVDSRFVPEFVPGLQLVGSFYKDIVAPMLTGTDHAAALVGEGSEVLGYDSVRSTDHSWGPRLSLFVEPSVVTGLQEDLATRLPEQYEGWPVRFYSWRTAQVEHHVEVTTVEAWIQALLGFDPRDGVQAAAWLATSQQVLLQITGGAVFHDDLGELSKIRELLRWYPADVWLWLMACQWSLIARDEALVGRTAEAGDELGSRLMAARLARDLMRQCFLQEQRYAPYDKWLAAAFKRLRAASVVDVDGLVGAAEFSGREKALVKSVEAVAERHNKLKVTPRLGTSADDFDVGIAGARRPYRVLNANRFAGACQEAIADVHLRRLELIGSIDQLTHASDLLINFTDWPKRLLNVYEDRLNQ